MENKGVNETKMPTMKLTFCIIPGWRACSGL